TTSIGEAMSRFSPAEIARVRALSEKLLRDSVERDPVEDEPPAPQLESREVPLPTFESDMDRWRREARESDERRAAAKAELRREEEANARARSTDWWSAIEAHVEQRIAAALVERQHEISELARAMCDFAAACDKRLVEIEGMLKKLSTAHVARAAA